MKRVFFVLLALGFFLCSIPFYPTLPAGAETPAFCRAVTNSVVLYKMPVCHYDYALFCIPYSYYLRIVDREGEFFLVEYQDNTDGFPKIYGYVEESAVSTEYQTPTLPLYPKQTLSVIRGSYVYTQPNRSAELLASALKDQTVRLYGVFPSKDGEDLFYYVKFGQVMGYLPAEACSAPKELIHPDPILTPSVEPIAEPSETAADPHASEKTVSRGKETIEIVLIVAITLAVLVIVYTMFRPKKPESRFFDDEDE